jgi:hypothetical protein
MRWLPLALLACTAPSETSLSGAAQKGPYLSGATVVAYELDPGVQQTGRSYTTTVTTDDGSWAIDGAALSGGAVLLTADGFYLDETTGQRSSGRLALRTYAPVGDTAHVTVLGHLAAPRVEVLVAGGADVTAALDQADADVLAALSLPGGASGHGTTLLDDDAAGATLLLLSSLVQHGLDVAGVTEALARLAGDLADGDVDEPELLAALEDAAFALRPADVQQHLVDHYATLGETVSPPDPADALEAFRAARDPDGDCVGSAREALDGTDPAVADVGPGCAVVTSDYTGGWPTLDGADKAALLAANEGSGQPYLRRVSLTDPYGEAVDVYDLSGSRGVVTMSVAMWEPADEVAVESLSAAWYGDCDVFEGLDFPACALAEGLRAGDFWLVVLLTRDRDGAQPSAADPNEVYNAMGEIPGLIVLTDPGWTAAVDAPLVSSPQLDVWTPELRLDAASPLTGR